MLKLFAFTHQYAKRLTDDIDDADFARQPHPGMNPPAWIIGHLVLAADFVPLLLSEQQVTDERWMATYGPGSTPTDDRSDYASKDELLELMKSTYARAIELARSATDEQLAAPNATPFLAKELPTVGDLIGHLLTTHGAAHLGQLSAWRRCLGKGSVLGI